MGGLLGRMVFDTETMPGEQWLYWVLGQYVGIGQRRSFGWGRYILESAETGRTLPRVGAMSSLLKLAYAEIADNQSGFENLAGMDDGERLIDLQEQLLNNPSCYQ